MTHFPVYVAVPSGAPPLEEYLAKVLAPYDENLEVAPYRESVSAERIDQAREYYSGSTVESDMYVEAKDFDPFKVWENWSGKALHSDADGYYEMSVYNPRSKWDWYEVGGRWAGMLKCNNHVGPDPSWLDLCQVVSLDMDYLLTYGLPTAVVDLEGAWHQRGRVGWFGTINEEATVEEWIAQVKKIIDGLPSDTILVVVDCHI